MYNRRWYVGVYTASKKSKQTSIENTPFRMHTNVSKIYLTSCLAIALLKFDQHSIIFGHFVLEPKTSFDAFVTVNRERTQQSSSSYTPRNGDCLTSTMHQALCCSISYEGLSSISLHAGHICAEPDVAAVENLLFAFWKRSSHTMPNSFAAAI